MMGPGADLAEEEPWKDPTEERRPLEEEGERREAAAAEVGIPYDLKEDIIFWKGMPVKVGAVLEVPLERMADDGAIEESVAALLVRAWERDEAGLWASVKLLGCRSEWAWQECVKIFSRKKHRLHLCRPADGQCPVHGEAGLHVTQLVYYPPGSLPEGYVEKRKVKEWRSFLEEHMVLPEAPPPDNLEPGREEAEGLPEGEPPGVTDRVSALRQRLFDARGTGLGALGNATPTGKVPSGRAPGRWPLESGHPGGGGRPAGRRREEALQAVKEERRSQVISSEDEAPAVKSGKRPVAEILRSLAFPKKTSAKEGQKKDSRRGKQKKGSKKKKKGKKKSSSSETEEESSSSSTGMLPPLQKKSKKRPGSVLEMLLQHVQEALAEKSITEDHEKSIHAGQAGKMMSYYQILVKPQLGGKIRDQRELETLARAIDLLLSGSIAAMSDVLSGRYIALETAAMTGTWTSAQFLEVAPTRSPGIAQAPLLLSAQRHHRLVEKAAGRQSWDGRGSSRWWGESRGGGEQSTSGGRGKGKGGKTVKGKNKKGKKGAWTDKPKEADEGATPAT